MKKALKIIGYGIGLLLAIFIIIFMYINFSFPNIELQKNFTAEVNDQRIERGKYLVNSVTGCLHCHSTVDFTKFSGKIVKGTEGKGGRFYPEEAGFPGSFYAANITPSSLKNWSDAEIYRAITSGVNKDGDALFPLMPYNMYKHLTIEDAKSIIAYLRTLQPVETHYAKSEFTFPFSLILKTIPTDPEPTDENKFDNNVAYGKYLVTIGGCEDCHTPSEGGKPDLKRQFAGGFSIPVETGGVCTSANITPDMETGIGSWTKEDFIQRFKFYLNIDSLNVNHGEYNTEMPWTVYAKMTEEDLGAIYDFLRTVAPVKNRVAKFTP